jgi:uncharacterized protein involved in outer membrane biogenesis
MKKWILLGGGAILVIIVVIVVVGLSNLGPMIKRAVNTYGPGITQTEVRLGDVGVSIFSAEAELKAFLLGNPKGFKSPKAMSVGRIYVNVDEKSITGNTIVIDRIEVIAPDITYEKISGRDNFQTILGNVKRATGQDQAGASPAQKEKKGAGKKLLIRDFIVRDGKVTLTMSALGTRTVTADLPDIHLKDIGKEKGGASPAEAFNEVFAALYGKITSPAVTDMFNKGIGEITRGSQAMAEEARKQLGTATEGAGEGVKSATDKLKGLFGR